MKKRTAGRPKKDIKEKKSVVISFRLTEGDNMKIKKLYGSIQKFLDLAIKSLPVIMLISCGGQSNESLVSEAKPSQDTSYTSEALIYSIVPYVNRHSGLGYKLTYKCNDSHCIVSGDTHSYVGEVLVKNRFLSSRLEVQGNNAYGEMCTITGQCYDATLVNKGQRLQIDNGSYCLFGGFSSNLLEYNLNVQSINSTQPFDFNSSPSSDCNI